MLNSNVMLLGFTVPDDVANDLFSVDPSPAVQTHKFAWSFARSLSYGFNSVYLVSACPIQNFPVARRLFFRGGFFCANGLNGTYISFVNLIVIKHVTRFISCLVDVPKIIKKNKIDWIFVHGVHSPFLFFGFLAKLFGIKFSVILTDPPGVVLRTDGFFAKLLKKFDSYVVKSILNNTDFVVALAPELASHLVGERPSLVFPGVLDVAVEKFLPSLEDDNSKRKPFTIVYAGGLNAIYGVDRLIEAVLGIEETPVLLKLFGRGDQENNVVELAKKDRRFFYGGFVGNDVLLPELSGADILINPRPSGEDFSRMSFPSKLIEYLAIGRPVLTTRIVSIPDSFKEHFYFIEDESALGIRAALLRVMSIPAEDLLDKGRKAKCFVVGEVSEASIGARIEGFIRNLSV